MVPAEEDAKELRQKLTKMVVYAEQVEAKLKLRDTRIEELRETLGMFRAADKLGFGDGPTTMRMAARHQADVLLDAEDDFRPCLFTDKQVRRIAKKFYERNGSGAQFGRTRTDEEDAEISRKLLNDIIEEERGK